jgi:GR25 family glycosyltransferase involved in LPS biosynthesis
MTIKVITLKRTPERMEEFCRKNIHIEYEVVNAVDGVTLDFKSIDMRSFFSENLSYTHGAYGCALSHIQLWIECIENNEQITICEDDAILHKRFKYLRDEKLRELPENWDICLWTWNLDAHLSIQLMNTMGQTLVVMDQNEMRNKINEFQEEHLKVQTYKLKSAFGTACYSISPAGARKLLSEILPLSHFELYFDGINRKIPNNGIDIAMNKSYKNINSFVAVPPIAVSPNFHQLSTIQML